MLGEWKEGEGWGCMKFNPLLPSIYKNRSSKSHIKGGNYINFNSDFIEISIPKNKLNSKVLNVSMVTY